MSLPTWMLLFGFRYCSAVRSQFDAHNQNDLILETGQQEFAGDKQKKEFPECYDIAKTTYPGGCNPDKSGFACYSKERVFQDVPVHWACSKDLDQTDISQEKCPLRPWHFDGVANGKHLNFTAPAGIYAGACQFSLPQPKGESTKAATTPKRATVVATTPGEPTVAAAATPEKPTEVATTPEQPTEGATTPEQSSEAATTPEKPSIVATTLEESTKTATTPEQSTKAATTPEKPSKIATTLEQLTDAATTSMQPETGTTTVKNGAAGNSVGSLLTTIFGLSLYSLH